MINEERKKHNSFVDANMVQWVRNDYVKELETEIDKLKDENERMSLDLDTQCDINHDRLQEVEKLIREKSELDKHLTALIAFVTHNVELNVNVTDERVAIAINTVRLLRSNMSSMYEKYELMSRYKDSAYHERNQLVRALSKLFPSWTSRHPEEDENWDKDWRWIVFIQLPTGQVSWHIHDSEYTMFSSLPTKENCWDGHSTEEKYERLNKLENKSNA